MNAAAPTIAITLARDTELPAAVSGQRHEIDSTAGRLSYYTASPAGAAGTPLLLIHSINAAGSAYEVKPVYEHYAQSRPVYAIELPGFGHASREKRPYTIRMMTDAIHAATAEIQKIHGATPIDALALSLSSEFLTRAATENPQAYRSVALVSPTGFDTRSVRWVRGSRAIPWLRNVFEAELWSERFFHLLTSRPVIGWFLQKTFGSPNYDKGLLDYDYLTTHQPGAQHAPYYFVSGFLFSQDVLRLYQSLPMPVWMSNGVRGDFIDYGNTTLVEGLPNWTVTVYQTGAMPHFEVLDKFVRDYDAFLASK
jgi:pimeloyl-ACP methyl ester carboxylesterase